MFNILDRLDPQRFSPSVCVLKKGGALESELIARNIPLIQAQFTLHPKPYGSLIKRARNASNAFKPYAFDLWHSFHYGDDYTEPLIAYFSGAKKWIYTKKAMGWGSRAWLLRSLLASRIVADNSEMSRLFFNRCGLARKTRVIHHGIPLDLYKAVSVDKRTFRQSLGLPDNAFLIGCVAHLVPVKGHPTLIETALYMPKAHIMLAGRDNDKDYLNQLKRQVASSSLESRVHFLGNVENIPSFLAQMDVAVLPTWDRWRREGCPVALLEAMACEKACVATNIPGSRDIIENGISGFLVPPEDAKSLASALNQLYENENLRRFMGQAARRRVQEHFTIEREVLAHQNLYMEALGY